MNPVGLKQVAIIVGATLFVLAFGLLGYAAIEGWNPVEALYMTVIALSTVGFGEVHPLSPPGRIFTTVLIFMGVGLLAYSASVVGAFFLDGTFVRYLRRRRMDKRITGMQGHCIVCGYGRTGQEVVALLRDRQIPFVVIDRDEDRIEELEDQGLVALQGNAHENEVLEEVGIHRAESIIACASNDAENVFIVLSAREIGPNLIIAARAEDLGSVSKIKRAGANKVISPYTIAGDRLVAAIYRPGVVEFLDTYVRKTGGYDLQESTVGEQATGKSLEDLKVWSEHQTIILAHRRPDGTITPTPDRSMQIAAGDELVAFGPDVGLKNLRLSCGSAERAR